MTVEYRWLRGGEYFGPKQTELLAEGTSLAVSGTVPPRKVDTWVALEVTSPVSAVSEKVDVASCVS